jgi:competence CoiA-like predicted nuclease
LITSCNAIDDLLTFTIDNQTTLKLVDSLLEQLSAYPRCTYQFSSTLKTIIRRLGVKCKISELKLTITNPTDKSLAFLKSVRLFISTDANDEIELAYLENINSTKHFKFDLHRSKFGQIYIFL